MIRPAAAPKKIQGLQSCFVPSVRFLMPIGIRRWGGAVKCKNISARTCTVQKGFFLSSTMLAILACLLWSTAFVGVKIGLRYADPFSFAGIRFMLAGLLLVPFWWRKRPSRKQVMANGRVILLVAFFQTFVLYAFFYLGMTMVSGAVAAILIGASPLTAAVTAHYSMRGDRMTPAKSLSLLLGMIGVVVISVGRMPWASPDGLMEFFGIVLLFLCTVSSAVGNVLVAGEKSDMDPVFLNSVQIFLGGFFLVLVSLVFEKKQVPLFDLPPDYFLALGWLSFLSAVSFTLWFVLLQRPGVKVSQLNLWKFIIPVCGAVFSWIILPDESPSLVPIIGMICIAVAIILYYAADMQLEKRAGPTGTDRLCK
jgi:drug/metabolite transporter (DMT)-like permease